MTYVSTILVAATLWGPAETPESTTTVDPTDGVTTPTADASEAAPPADATETPAATEAAATAEAEAPVADAAGPAEGTAPAAAPGEADPSWNESTAQPGSQSPASGAPLAAQPAPAAPPQPAPPPPPRPIRWRLDLGIAGGGTLVGDQGYRAFSEGRVLIDGSFSALFDFRLAEGRVFLGGGVAHQILGREGDAYGADVFTSIDMHEPEVRGRVSVMAIEGLDAFARVGVGPSIVDLSFDSIESASQRAVIPRVEGHGGLSLYLPKAWLPRKQAGRITAGLQLGVGYTWRGAIDVRPTLSQGDDPLEATTSPLGELSLHGMSWRAGLFLRLM
ncbi:MAG: hypothetical protein AAF799_46980 [Myxococcota bacterium]